MKNALRPWIFISIFIFTVSLNASAETIQSESRITDVTVYPGSALVQRTAQVQLSAGEHAVIFEGIVPEIDENTLTVSGEGDAKVKIFGAHLKKEFLKESPDARVKDLESKIESLDDQINHEKSALAVFDREKEFLESVKLFSEQQIPKDLVTKMPPSADLENTLNFLSARFSSLEKRKEEVDLKIRGLKEQKDALEKELSQIRGVQEKMKRSIAVDLECLEAGKLTLKVSYSVAGANWNPVYDARAVFEKNEVELALFGIVGQTTGEDWLDAALSISTAKPTIGGKMPELEPWYLRPYEPFQRDNRKAKMADMLYQQSYGAGAVPPQAMEREIAGKKEDVQFAYAQAENKGTAVVYKVKKAVSIKSDGSEHRVPITSQNLSARFEYAATPKLSPYAYLKTEVANSKDNQLLAGRVNIFLDGDYMGISQIAKVVGSEEKFDLYLGIDEGITVKRKLLEEKSDDTLVGGIPSSSKTIHYAYKLIVENYKPKAAHICLFDQIPVSQDDKIKVKNVKFDVKPTMENYKDRSGVVVWEFDLVPKAQKEITYSYTVEHPRNLDISGL